MRILLIEDDEILGDATSIYLRNNGYAVDWAKDGKQADLALHDDVYEVVILDLSRFSVTSYVNTCSPRSTTSLGSV